MSSLIFFPLSWFPKADAVTIAGLGGAAFPFLIQALYDRFSYKTAMIAMVSLCRARIMSICADHCLCDAGPRFYHSWRHLGLLHEGTHPSSEAQSPSRRPRGRRRQSASASSIYELLEKQHILCLYVGNFRVLFGKYPPECIPAYIRCSIGSSQNQRHCIGRNTQW